MTRKFAIFGLVMMLTFAFAGVASASPTQNAANNASQCSSAGGVFVAGTGGAPNTCTFSSELDPVTFDVITKASGNSGKGWTISGSQEQSEQIVVTKGSGPGVVGDPTVISGDQIITGCYNPGGKEKELDHENCQ